MDNFLKTKAGFETACKLIETINRTTDDYLFIWDIRNDVRWFFGDIDAYYDIRVNGSEINSTPEMMQIIHPADRAAVLASLTEITEGKKDTHNMDYRWINRKGEKVWINCHGNVIRDENNRPYLMIGRVSEESLRHLFNPLTSLWNKTKLREDLKTILTTSKGYLMLLEIDGLSAINLSHGREYGNELLKEIAQLCENVHGATAAYHINNNSFAIVLNIDREEQVAAVFETIRETMLEKCNITASAVPIDKDLFLDETQLLDSVNLTLKKAKDISANRIEFFSVEDLSRKIAELELLEELKQSAENDFEGFELYYQPQIHSGNYEIYGVEALLRYNSRCGGKVFPDAFIPILEQSGLIKDVGLWVLREAAIQCKKWRAFLPQLQISVNFSVIQFEDMHLAEKVLQILNETGLAYDALTIEITESMELHKSERIIDAMKLMRSCGVKFAIDDFGTGYSNLGYLKQLDVDEIKIDRIFVAGIEKDTYNHKLISNVIEFAKDNAIRTCCEGVESPRELAILEMLLPDAIQGYLFDKPNTAQNVQKAYMDADTPEYQQRQEFVKKIYEIKGQMGVLHFDPKDILRENGVGLWVMRLKEASGYRELHVDETMEQVMAVDAKYTAKECYDYWQSNIHPEDFAYVQMSLSQMIAGKQAHQIEFKWQHPELGDVMVRFSGKRVNDSDGMIVLEGYYRMIEDAAHGLVMQ